MNGPYPDLAAAAADLGILLSDDGGYVAAPLGLEVKPEALQELPSRHAQRPAMTSALPRSSQPAPLPVGPPPNPPSEAPTLETDGSATPPATEVSVTPVLRASGSSREEPPDPASGPPSLLDLPDTEVEDAMSAFVSEADTAVRHGTPTLTLHVKPEPPSDAAPDVAPAAEEPAAEDCGTQPDVSDGVVDRSAGVLSVVVPREVGALEPVPPALNADPAHASGPAGRGRLAILTLPKGILEPAGHEESDHLSATTPEPTVPGRSQESREETDRASRPAARLRRLPRRLVILVASLGILLTAGLVAGGYYIVKGADRPGRLRLESTPNGATVVREGRNLGTTPLVVDLPPGAHFLEIRGRYSTYTLAVSVRPRGEVHESVKLPEAAAPGELRVSTWPPGARVSIDGKERGLAPLTLRVPPGLHRISASNEVGSAEREVTVPTARATAVQLPISGWIDASSPVPVKMTISGRPTGLGRVALPPGRYRVEFVNDEIAFHDLQEVVVEAGKAVAITPGGLTAMLDVTSDAPADVVVDGRAVGRTPISNLSLPIGKHDVKFATDGVGEVRYEIVLAPGSNRLHGTVASAAPTKAVAVPQNRLPRAPRPR
jgi:hypothetical protein